MGRRTALVAIAFAGLFCVNLLATPIIGTFNIAGTATATLNTLTWTSNVSPFPPDKATIGPGPTGIFSALGGTTATIDDLNRATEPIGSSFPAQPFLAFDAAPGLSPLLINFIFTGIYSPAGCAASPPDVGQTCTPSQPGAASPFNFVNNPPPPSQGGPTSTATFSVQGISADGKETWFGVFTSQFGTSFQQVLSAFAPGGSGSVTNTYSATITVSEVTPVPEPSTAIPVSFALIAMSVFLRRRFQTR
jgi:hypothetical protein